MIELIKKQESLTDNACSVYYQLKLVDICSFELRSLYGRTFLSKKPNLKTNDKNLLNLGCGFTKFDGWVNADFFSGIRFWKKVCSHPDWMLDLRFPLKCDDNVWDGVFSEHTIEHLYPNQVLSLLKELHRTMKPGAWLRITVPNLEKYIRYYNGENVDSEFTQWHTGCEAIRTLTQDFGHISLWDSDLLSKFLKISGFENIQEVSFRQGTDKSLLKDKEARQWETLYMEAKKGI
jgi:predicted SAM-dependent methyltransferase